MWFGLVGGYPHTVIFLTNETVVSSISSILDFKSIPTKATRRLRLKRNSCQLAGKMLYYVIRQDPRLNQPRPKKSFLPDSLTCTRYGEPRCIEFQCWCSF